MDDGKGITEEFWSKTVSDDAKMMWRVGSRGATFLMALLLPKTGFHAVDIGVGVLTMLIPLLVIETQRAYSKFSPGFLAWVIRISVFTCGVAMASLGLLIYSGMVVPVVLVVGGEFFQQFVGSSGIGQNMREPLGGWWVAVVITLAVMYAVVENFRGMKVFERIYHLPREQMERLMKARPMRTNNWLEFAGFEACVLICSFCYTGLASQAAPLVVDGLQRLLALFDIRL